LGNSKQKHGVPCRDAQRRVRHPLVPVHSPLTNYITALSYLFVDNATAARVIYGVLGVVAVVAAYAVARRYFGVTAAVITGLLLAVHGPLVEWSRFAWNPNWGQAFGVLWLGAALVGFIENKPRAIAFSWVMLGLLLQSHTSNVLLLLPAAGLTAWHFVRFAQSRGRLVLATAIGGTLALVTMIPWLLGLADAGVFTVEHWRAALATEEAVATGSAAPGPILEMMARNVTGAFYRKVDRELAVNVPGALFPPFALDRVLRGYGLLLLIVSIPAAGMAVWRGRARALPVVVLAGVVWLLYVGGLLSTLGPTRYFLITGTLAGVMLHGWLLAQLWARLRVAALLLTAALVGINGWAVIAGLHWQQMHGIYQPLDASLTAYTQFAREWTANGERSAVVLIDDDVEIGEIDETARQVRLWEVVGAGYPVQPVHWKRVESAPLNDGGTLLVELPNQSVLPDVFGGGAFVPQRTLLDAPTFRALTVTPADYADVRYVPDAFAGFVPGVTVDGIHAGQALTAGADWRGTLVWRPTVAAQPVDYVFSLRLIDSEGTRYAMTDVAALPGRQWQVGDVVVNPFRLAVPSDYPADEVPQFRLVMYGFTGPDGADESVDAVNAQGQRAPWLTLEASRPR
jgi:hypothetical protein